MEAENLDQIECNFNIYFILSTYFIVINFHIVVLYNTTTKATVRTRIGLTWGHFSDGDD